MALTFAVPALRARAVENTFSAFQEAVAAFAEGSGRSPDDPGVQAFVGCLIGGLLPVLARWATGGYQEDLEALIDQALDGVREILSRR
jgi:hypothetical protein